MQNGCRFAPQRRAAIVVPMRGFAARGKGEGGRFFGKKETEKTEERTTVRTVCDVEGEKGRKGKEEESAVEIAARLIESRSGRKVRLFDGIFPFPLGCHLL